MGLTNEELNLEYVQNFLKDQERILERNRNALKKNKSIKYRHSAGPLENELHTFNSFKDENSPANSIVTFNNQTKDKRMVKDNPMRNVIVNSREKEKERLINLLSVPKTSRHSCPNIKVQNKPILNYDNFVFNAREREKDRLAAIFASSSSQFSKSSCQSSDIQNQKLISNDYQINYKTNSELPRVKNKDKKSTLDKRSASLTSEGNSSSLSRNCDIPKILISQYQEDLDSSKNIADTLTKDPNSMVRIGEFSPHNPNLSGGKLTLGIGEWEERRKLLREQQKEEYNEYLQQLSRSHTPSGDAADHNHSFRSVATQTEWEDEVIDNRELERSPRQPRSASLLGEQPCSSLQFRTSPIPMCFGGLSEKEIKEYIYREELRKQIEEKHKLKEEMKRKEAEEEAKIEAKIQRDLEEMRKQYEAERLQRLELAIRKKEQEDILRQRLAAEQQKASEESKTKKKHLLKKKSTSPKNTSTQRYIKSTQSQLLSTHLNQPLPTTCASAALSNVHEVLKQPLLEPQDHKSSAGTYGLSPRERNIPSRKNSALDQPLEVNKRPLVTMSPPIHRVKEVDVLAQKAVFDAHVPGNYSQQNGNELPSYSSDLVRDKIKEVDNMLRQPLLPESFQVLPPMSPPLLHATIPPLTSSLQPSVLPPPSPPVPASRRVQRTNSEILEDKWKVPYVERYNVAPSDVSTKHNRSVLTQLGAFRRHLQEERLRMQQRVQDETP